MKYNIIWITGASSGIGAALAEHYADDGVILGLVTKNIANLKDVVSVCQKKGAKVYAYGADVSNAEQVNNAAKSFLFEVGKVDLVIANAGIRGEEDLMCQDWKLPYDLMMVNYIGVINTFSPFIPGMFDKKHGQLAVISSIAALRGTPNSGAYSASKAAVNLWTESLRLRCMPFGVGLTTICMGFVDTAMTKDLKFSMPGILSATEAAKLISDSIAKRRRVVIHPWQSKLIWTVFMCLPGMLYDKIILWAKSRHSK